MTKHQKKSIAVAVGIFCGLLLSVITLICYQTGYYGAAFLEIVRSLSHPLYTISPNGAITILCLGFLSFGLGTYLLLTIYEIIERKSK